MSSSATAGTFAAPPKAGGTAAFSLQEIEARLRARVLAAVHQPERGPGVRAVLEQLLAVLDATRADGVI
jgi:hypothetical protein